MNNNKNITEMQEQQEVLVKKTTLNAIKKMMFGKTGIDLSNIVNDITMGVENDLAAINVALAFQGFKPEFDKTPRFDSGWKSYSKYEVIAVSLITEFARVHITQYKYDKETDSFVLKEEHEGIIPYETFDGLGKDEEAVKKRAKD